MSKESIRKRRKARARRRRIFFGTLLFIVVTSGLFFFSGTDYFLVKEIQINGNSHFTDQEIISRANAKTGDNMFRSSFEKWRTDLLENAYIKEVTIQRKMPDKIKIIVEERKEYAAITFIDKFVIIDNEGYALRTSSAKPDGMTEISGITLSNLKLGEKLQSDNDLVLEKTLGAMPTLENEGLVFPKINIDGLLLKISIYDKLFCETTSENLLVNIDNLKDILLYLHDSNTKRGVIKIGDNGYIAYSPEVY